MRTIRRLIYREVVSAVVFVAAGFLALFFFFDFVDELPNVGKGAIASYRLPRPCCTSPCCCPTICTSCCRSPC